MEAISFDELLLKTAFCCMSCDGEIDTVEEVPLFREFCSGSSHFSELDFEKYLTSYIKDINDKGSQFLKEYLLELKDAELSDEKALILIGIALQMIYADNKVEFSEMKFFKLIRSHLKVSNDEIIEKFPTKNQFLRTSDEDLIMQMADVEQFLEEDIINESYMDRISRQYFETAILPQFELVKILNNDIPLKE